MTSVLLTVSTTHAPATDLGFLLVKHPDRVHRVQVPTGTAMVCFPEATHERCTAALLLDVDLTGRLRPPTPEGFALGRFVNDRAYAASSLLASALNRVFRSAMRASSKDRPDLAQQAIPLEVRIPVLRCRGGAELVERLFIPLGWQVTAAAIALDEQHPEWGPSRYLDLTLTGTVRLADALNQLYILLPALDDAKHYWVGPDEIEKLLRAGEGWLADHPERALIAARYLAHRRELTATAMTAIEAGERLAALDDTPELDTVDGVSEPAADEDANLPVPATAPPLAEQRRRAVLGVLAEVGPSRLLDLGCGAGALLRHLMAVKSYTEIVGVDVSPRALDQASRRLRLDRQPGGRVRLLQSALTYADDRLVGFDAAVLMEVVEHLDLDRLPALADNVFGHARPSTVVVTTPNVEYNAHYAGLASGAHRHPDHRFEWTRAEFADWCATVCARHPYRVELRGVGEPDPALGTPTQMAIFTRQEVTS